MNQTERILQHMKEYGSITSQEAMQCQTRISHR